MADLVELHRRLEIARGLRHILVRAPHRPVEHAKAIHGERVVGAYGGRFLEVGARDHEEVELQGQQAIVPFELGHQLAVPRRGDAESVAREDAGDIG